ncbi:COP1-interacting protein 7-like [Phoenix dactylifera]|uniref:COP1-interacting protein 7-like n=1 Tax=Phoenix dactylifera TaxID=42345 RepID=A0A8B7BTU1_PHODC|nr:COP1-interacting protein 7-like [Phoenix dactylifera]
MKQEARLDSLVFHLTPTRTRCDLVIVANGKTEKIASGLLNPFLAHLKTAQDQIAKGGYSIKLEPDPKIDAVWFTKGIVERFVRFVSTPEVLERVTTIESEILQIEEAIAIQSTDNLGLSTVEDHQTKPVEYTEGSKSTFDADAEKAIVLYKPGSQPHPSDSNGSAPQEENSKVQLLRVLETRKIVLQKEQGMAFARAVAAGFDMDHMAQLISFAECFGALRLMEACLRFMELWKRKHETGQWVEVEAAEVMSARSEFSSLNASGIILSGDSRKQKEFGDAWPVSCGDMGTESNGTTDRKIHSDPQVPLGPNEYYPGHFQHPIHPQWPVHSLAGPPLFQLYPMQGMPYYQNYPGGGPSFHSPYSPVEDPRFNTPQKTWQKRHSMDSKDSNTELEASEMGGSGTRSQDGADQNISEFEKEGSHGRESHKRIGRSGKKKSGVVVIRNINYITSKRHDTSGSESVSASDSETEEESEDMSDDHYRKHKNSSRTSKRNEVHVKSMESLDAYAKDEITYGPEADSENWQAFQSYLLRAEEKARTVDGDIFASEKEPPIKRKQNNGEGDPILLPERDSGNVRDQRMVGLDSLNGKAIRMKQMASNDELLISSEGKGLIDSQLKEIEGGRGGYRSVTSDDFMIYGREKQMSSKNSSDPLVDLQYELDKNLDKKSSYNGTDESFIVPFRSGSQDQLGQDGRTAIDIDSECPPALHRTEDSSSKPKNQLTYEPDDLILLPERGMESVSIGYDPAKDYDIQIPVENAVKIETRNNEDVSTSTKEESKNSDKDKKSKVSQSKLEKKKKDALMRKGTSSKMNPPAEAQKRAEKLRAFKADLQKAKKEMEEEEIKRLEALKRERQKRIAARGSSNATQPPLTPQQSKSRLPKKLSPSSYRGSKFNDSDPGSSPLQKLPTRTSSVGSNDSQKITRTSKLNGSSHGLSRSVSSLSEMKKETGNSTPEAKTASVQTRRLSDPKGSNVRHTSSLKSVTSAEVPKIGIPDEPQKRISALMQLDKSKLATLPELKVRTSKGPSNMVQNKSAAKETSQKGTVSRTSQFSDTIHAKRINNKASRLSNSHDNLVIEKTVVMLKNEVLSAPAVQAFEAVIGIEDRMHGDDKIETVGLNSEYGAIHAPPSPIIVGEVENSSEHELDEQLNSDEVVIDYSKEEPQKFSNSTVIDKPYQAPYAGTTSFEDSTADNVEYAQVLPVRNSEMDRMPNESIEACVSSFAMDSNSVDHTQESHKEPRSKETKGFRKLLKFGRKSHISATGEGNQDSDASSIDEHAIAAASLNDVHMLKNLISQDDSHAGGTQTKVSRPFSILSPFRSRSSDKKVSA